METPIGDTKMLTTPIEAITKFSGRKENQSISLINNFFTRSPIKNLKGKNLDFLILKWLVK